MIVNVSGGVPSAILSTETICSSRSTTRSSSQKIWDDKSRAKVRIKPAIGASMSDRSTKIPEAPRTREVNVSIALANATQICI